MKKVISALTVIVMVFLVLFQPTVQAASAIKIYIDGKVLVTDQAPLLIEDYTFVPLRGIFEALHAQILWNQKTQTVTAKKKDTTIVLKIGSNTATINNQIVPLQAPARIVNNRTIVPVRFISESLGGDVIWNQKSQSVLITSAVVKQVSAVSYFNASIVSQYGDGRDLQISFTPPSDKSNVNHYRVLVVKEANASSMNLAKAQIVGESNFTIVSTSSAYPLLNLTSQSRDVDGALIVANQVYKVFVLTVGTDNYALSSSSASLIVTRSSVNAPTNVIISDIRDYGDGRDLQISFNRAVDDSRISLYRIFIVRAADYGSFNVTEANKVSAGRYYDVIKSGYSYSQTLSSTSKDVQGNTLTDGVAYRVFVMGVTNHSSYASVLSTSSASITLVNSGVSAVTNLGVNDVSDYNNGLDLRVDFTKASNESNINHYRILVVKDANASSFNLTSANAVTNSNNYTIAAITGSNYSQVLSAGARDVNGDLIQNGISYRVFVMTVGGGSSSGMNVLSSYSSALSLSNNSVTAVTNVSVSDVSDYNNGLDLRVTYTKASIESNINHYRILVVKDAFAGIFNLASANAVTNSNNYTIAGISGSNYNQVLSSGARDVNGDLIQNGVSYRVFVMTVGGGSSSGTNVLSTYSSAISLSNTSVLAVTNVSASDVSDNNNGQDLQVAFTKIVDESNINQYRIFVVKDINAGSFNLATANAISSSNYYTIVSKTGNNISQVLPSGALDVNGVTIQNSIAYRVFVLSVANGNTNAISISSNSIVLAPTPPPVVPAPIVQDVTALQIGAISDLILVNFTKPADESGIDHYAVLIVPNSVGVLTESMAISYHTAGTYTRVEKTVGTSTLTSASVDVLGVPLVFDVQYQVYVLSVANGTTANQSKLSSSIASVKLIQPV